MVSPLPNFRPKARDAFSDPMLNIYEHFIGTGTPSAAYLSSMGAVDAIATALEAGYVEERIVDPVYTDDQLAGMEQSYAQWLLENCASHAYILTREGLRKLFILGGSGEDLAERYYQETIKSLNFQFVPLDPTAQRIEMAVWAWEHDVCIRTHDLSMGLESIAVEGDPIAIMKYQLRWGI